MRKRLPFLTRLHPLVDGMIIVSFSSLLSFDFLEMFSARRDRKVTFESATGGDIHRRYRVVSGVKLLAKLALLDTVMLPLRRLQEGSISRISKIQVSLTENPFR